MTLQEKFLKHFTEEELGYKEEKRTAKYIVLEKEGERMYLGKRGAIRLGRTLSNSIPINPHLYKALVSTVNKKFK